MGCAPETLTEPYPLAGPMPRVALLIAFGLVAMTFAAPVALAEPGPCPGGGYSCSPPLLCGWAPDPVRDPVGYATFWPNCLLRDALLP